MNDKIPDYIRTEWKSRGSANINFKSTSCKSCKSFIKKTTKRRRASQCDHKRDVTFYISTFNVWEFKEKNQDSYGECEEAVNGNIYETQNFFGYNAPQSVSQEVWNSWNRHWNEWQDTYGSLSWVRRFRRFCDDETIIWYEDYCQKNPSFIPYLSFCGNLKLDTEEGLKTFEEIDNSDSEKNIKQEGSSDILQHVSNFVEYTSSVSESGEVIRDSILKESKSDKNDTSSTLSESHITNGKQGNEFQNEVVKSKILDDIYYELLNKRYWAHLRLYLRDVGVPFTDDLREMFEMHHISDHLPDVYSVDSEDCLNGDNLQMDELKCEETSIQENYCENANNYCDSSCLKKDLLDIIPRSDIAGPSNSFNGNSNSYDNQPMIDDERKNIEDMIFKKSEYCSSVFADVDAAKSCSFVGDSKINGSNPEKMSNQGQCRNIYCINANNDVDNFDLESDTLTGMIPISNEINEDFMSPDFDTYSSKSCDDGIKISTEEKSLDAASGMSENGSSVLNETDRVDSCTHIDYNRCHEDNKNVPTGQENLKTSEKRIAPEINKLFASYDCDIYSSKLGEAQTMIIDVEQRSFNSACEKSENGLNLLKDVGIVESCSFNGNQFPEDNINVKEKFKASERRAAPSQKQKNGVAWALQRLKHINPNSDYDPKSDVFIPEREKMDNNSEVGVTERNNISVELQLNSENLLSVEKTVPLVSVPTKSESNLGSIYIVDKNSNSSLLKDSGDQKSNQTSHGGVKGHEKSISQKQDSSLDKRTLTFVESGTAFPHSKNAPLICSEDTPVPIQAEETKPKNIPIEQKQNRENISPQKSFPQDIIPSEYEKHLNKTTNNTHKTNTPSEQKYIDGSSNGVKSIEKSSPERPDTYLRKRKFRFLDEETDSPPPKTASTRSKNDPKPLTAHHESQAGSSVSSDLSHWLFAVLKITSLLMLFIRFARKYLAFVKNKSFRLVDNLFSSYSASLFPNPKYTRIQEENGAIKKIRKIFSPFWKSFPMSTEHRQQIGKLSLSNAEKREDNRALSENLIQVLPPLEDQSGHESLEGLHICYLTEQDVDQIICATFGTDATNSGGHEGLTRTVTYFDDDGLAQDVIQLPSEGNKSECHGISESDNWFSGVEVRFDSQGNPVAVPAQSPYLVDGDVTKEEAWHKKLNKVHSGCSLMRNVVASEKCPSSEQIPESVRKYWMQRYRLFLRFDEGIRLDHESWYSVTPEAISGHHAERLSCGVALDAFCGAGGNAIQLAFTCEKVVAIDVDAEKIRLARNNARVYGVEDRIEFIHGDFFEVAPKVKADCVLLSPPWGGIDYGEHSSYDVFVLGGQMDGRKMFETALKVSPNIALYLPKNSNLLKIAELALMCPGSPRVDVEYSFISNKRKSLTAYYGDLVDFNVQQ